MKSLRELDLFSTLTLEEIACVESLLKQHDIPKGGILFQEGDDGQDMYIVLSGTVMISVMTEENEEVEISQVSAGGFFGEMSVIEQDVRSATCRTVEKSTLLSLGVDSFRFLMTSKPNIAMKIMQRMLTTTTTRLQKTGSFLSDMVKWGEDARIRAVTDDFTGLYNRRFFDDSLARTITDATNSGQLFCLVMLDLDHFGTLNAEYGESVGDAVIQAAVPIFRQSFHPNDILTRYGGDEFAFLALGKTGGEVLDICIHVGESLRQLDILPQGGSFKSITASIGIAICPDHGYTTHDLLSHADKALYAAKEFGRDQAVLFRSGL